MSKDSPVKPNSKNTSTVLPSNSTTVQSKYARCLSSVTSSQHVSWHGGCYLPPCNCSNISSSTEPCKEASNTNKYDFKSLADSEVQKNLVNLSDYVIGTIRESADKDLANLSPFSPIFPFLFFKHPYLEQ